MDLDHPQPSMLCHTVLPHSLQVSNSAHVGTCLASSKRYGDRGCVHAQSILLESKAESTVRWWCERGDRKE